MSHLLATLAGDREIEALLSDEAQLGAMLRFEVALAAAEADAGLIGEAAAGDIAAAAAVFAPDWPALHAGMKRDGVVVPALIAQLRATLPEPSRKALHLGATSQDAVDTALILQLDAILPILMGRIEGIGRQLDELGKRFGANRLMAHTRMQAALPFTVADKLRTWKHAVERQRAAFLDLLPDLLVVQLGGPIGNCGSFGAQGDRVCAGVASRLGLRPVQNWHTTRDRITVLGSRLAMLAGTLGKLGADVALLAQGECRAVILSGAGGSSSMPHKNNPVGAELLVALARYCAGLAGTLHHAMIHENERSGSAWTLEWLVLPQLLVSAGASLLTASELLANIRSFGEAVHSRDGMDSAT